MHLGLFICIMGLLCRSIAMYTAGKNFTHIIRDKQINDHVLVTNGVYRYIHTHTYTYIYT